MLVVQEPEAVEIFKERNKIEKRAVANICMIIIQSNSVLTRRLYSTSF